MEIDIDDKIDTLTGLAYDEFKTLIEQLVCNTKMCNNYLIYEARFMKALAELKNFCGMKMAGTKKIIERG